MSEQPDHFKRRRFVLAGRSVLVSASAFHLRFRFSDFGQDGGEFEINQTKASVGKPVGDVARIGVVVAHAEFFQLGEQFFRARSSSMCSTRVPQLVVTMRRFFSSASSRRGTKSQPRCSRWRSTRISFANRSARVRAVIRLEHPAIKTQMDGGAERVFDFQHTTGTRRFCRFTIADFRREARPLRGRKPEAICAARLNFHRGFCAPVRFCE